MAAAASATIRTTPIGSLTRIERLRGRVPALVAGAAVAVV
jgi:hypothetical protein